MKKMLTLSLSYLLFCYIFGICNSQTINAFQKAIYVDRILNALRAAIQFYDREHMFVNLDAITGTRLVEGQTGVLYQKLLRQQTVDAITLNRIRDINVLAGTTSDKAIPYIAANAPQSFQNFIPLLQRGFWVFDFPYQNLPRQFRIWVFRGSVDNLLDNGMTDRCIGEVIGTRSSRCGITPTCWRSMTSPGYHGYSLSHQQVYLTIGLLSGCNGQMERMRIYHGQPSINYISSEMCANMLVEARRIARDGYPIHQRDLFMEIVEFCGMVSIRETFPFEWLERILSWQNPLYGCYTDIENLNARSNRKRKKRSEQRHRNGCLSHMTAVAIGALTQYLRFLLEGIA